MQALVAERNSMRKKNKSLCRDLKKLIHTMEQSVPKREVRCVHALLQNVWVFKY